MDQNWATGKRKTAVAQVQFFPKGKGNISINKKTVKEYFPVFDLFQIVLSPLKLLNQEKVFDFRIKVHGGGMKSQAEAARLGIARALVVFNPEWRKELKSAGFLRRDARKKERKKPGLKRARRAPQWAKR
ncbi:30S ribosomal protein S9 [Patescibacteria group bacterium]|nr:30S ribosomal protein S9 [Patescibacteria group bacterium]